MKLKVVACVLRITFLPVAFRDHDVDLKRFAVVLVLLVEFYDEIAFLVGRYFFEQATFLIFDLVIAYLVKGTVGVRGGRRNNILLFIKPVNSYVDSGELFGTVRT